MRDFVLSGLAYLMKQPAEPELVKNYLNSPTGEKD